jgi:hypothetical protein
MSAENNGFLKTGLPPWLVVVLGLVLLALVTGFGLALRSVFASPGDRSVVTVTRIKEPNAAPVMIKRVRRFKDGSTQITLAIGGGRSNEEPFAFYANETRSEFHWDQGKLDACVEGATFNDKSFWLDHVELPDGGDVQIVKTCPVHASLTVFPGKTRQSNLGTPA